MLDTALEAKVLANKDESKCFKPLIAVIRPVRDRYKIIATFYKSIFYLNFTRNVKNFVQKFRNSHKMER